MYDKFYECIINSSGPKRVGGDGGGNFPSPRLSGLFIFLELRDNASGSTPD